MKQPNLYCFETDSSTVATGSMNRSASLVAINRPSLGSLSALKTLQASALQSS